MFGAFFPFGLSMLYGARLCTCMRACGCNLVCSILSGQA